MKKILKVLLQIFSIVLMIIGVSPFVAQIILFFLDILDGTGEFETEVYIGLLIFGGIVFTVGYFVMRKSKIIK